MIQKAFGVELLRSIRLKSKPGKQSCFHFVIKIELHLTDEEKRRGRVREWLPLQEAINLFSKQ